MHITMKLIIHEFMIAFVGCGPTIVTKFKLDPAKKYNGTYDTSGWIIDNRNFEKDLEELYGKNYREEHKTKKKRHLSARAENSMPGGGNSASVDIKSATSAVPSQTKDGLLAESTVGSMKPISTGPSNGLMEDLSVPSSLRSRGKDFLNVGNDALPKAPIGSFPPIPPTVPPVISGGSRPPSTISPRVNSAGAGGAATMGGGSGSATMGGGSVTRRLEDTPRDVPANSNTNTKNPPPSVSRAPRRSDGKNDGISMGKLAGPPSMSPEKFFSDGTN